MRDQEIVGLYEAYQSIYSNVNEEVEQLDELKLDTMLSARKEREKRIDDDIEAGNVDKATAGMRNQDRTKRLIRRRRNPDSVAGTPHFHSGSTAYRKEEVETWVNSLVEEGYDLSDYTWDDMVEIYVNEEITSEKGKAKAAEMIAKRTTASGRAKLGQGDTVALIRHISRANVDGYGGTPPNRKTAKNPVKSNFTGLKGGTGNKAARRAGLTPTREKPNAWKEEVETWVNSLVEEGYDLSDYTWDDMYEMYMNLDEEAPQRIQLEPSPKVKPDAGPARLHNPTKRKKVKKVIKETNLFNYLLEYLVAEGYADTNKAAINIMSHMSEEWKQSIVEEVLDEKKGERPRGLPYGPVGRGFRELTVPQRQKMMKKAKKYTQNAMNSGEEYGRDHGASSAIDSALRSRRLGGRG